MTSNTTNFTLNNDGQVVDAENNLISPLQLSEVIQMETNDEMDTGRSALVQRFEDLLLTGNENSLRQCRSTNTTQEEFDSVTPGNFIELPVSGGGQAQWYYYLSRNGTHMFVFKAYSETYSYRILEGRPRQENNYNDFGHN